MPVQKLPKWEWQVVGKFNYMTFMLIRQDFVHSTTVDRSNLQIWRDVDFVET